MSNNLLYKKYSKELSKMVGSDDFHKLLTNDVNNKIMKYSDLDNINNINDILKINDYRIILIETNKNSGHWCCINKYNDNVIYWFDSYSLFPDQEFEFISPEMQKILDEDTKPLSKLLNKFKQDGGKWDYNKVKFQEQKDNINTCGRHVAFYLYCVLKYNYSLEDYQNTLISLKNKNKLPYDILICEFTKVLN